jgi:hypothetical protein
MTCRCGFRIARSIGLLNQRVRGEVVILAIMETLPNTTGIKFIESAPKLVYRFIDSSVPPEYHRSYTIAAAPEKVNVMVDSYGDILAEYDFPLSEKSFREFLTELRQIIVFQTEPGENQGCPGGKTDKFDIQFEDLNISGYVYHCANQRYGNLTGNTDGIVSLFKALVPGLTRKIKV